MQRTLYRTAGKCKLPRGKVRYPSQQEAQLALAVIKGQGSRKHTESRAYHCPVCDGWHLTSMKNADDIILSGSVLQKTNPDAFDAGMRAFAEVPSQGRYSSNTASLTRRVRHLLHLFSTNGIPEESWDNPWLWTNIRFRIMWRGGDGRAEGFIATSKRALDVTGDLIAADTTPFLHMAETQKERHCLERTPLPAWIAVADMTDRLHEEGNHK